MASAPINGPMPKAVATSSSAAASGGVPVAALASSNATAAGATSERRTLSIIFHRFRPESDQRRGLSMKGSSCQSPRTQR